MNGSKPEMITIGEDGVTEDSLIKHDKTDINWATMLANMEPHKAPLPMGVLYQVEAPVYENDMHTQIQSSGKAESMQKILESGSVWTVD